MSIPKIHSLTEFQRNAKDYISRIKQSGQAEILTVNGEAEVVIQSTASYQQLVEDAELSRALRVIRKSLEDARAGRIRPVRQALETLAAKHGLTLEP